VNEQERDTRLDRLLADLPTELEPSRDLWPGIEQRLDLGSARRGLAGSRWMTGMAASLALAAVIAVTALSLARLSSVPGQGTSELAAGVTVNEASPAGGISAGLDTVRAVPAQFAGGLGLGADYLRDHEALAQRFGQQLDALPPETRQAVTKNLEDIRRALHEINGALSEHPDNALLQQLLLATYREELAMFVRVDRLSNSRQERTDL